MSQSKKYRSLICKQDRDVDKNLSGKLCGLESSNPKEFWKLLNKIKSRSENDNVNNIGLNEWKEHFQQIYKSSDVIDKMSLYHDEELINLEQKGEENVVSGRHFTVGEIKKHKISEK